MSSQGTRLCLSSLGILLVSTMGVSTTPAFAGHHPDVKIRIIQRSGAPATVTVGTGSVYQLQTTGSAAHFVLGAAPVSYSAAPVTYSAAPVTYSAAPLTYSAAPVTFAAAPTSGAASPTASGGQILVPVTTSSGSSTGAAAPSSDDMVDVQIGSTPGRIPRSALNALAKENGESARAPGGSATTQAAPSTGQQYYIVAAPSTSTSQAAPNVQAAPIQFLMQAAPPVLQMQAATMQVQTQPAQGTTFIIINRKLWCP